MDDISLLAVNGCDEEAAMFMMCDMQDGNLLYDKNFNLENVSEEDCWTLFRFKKSDILPLKQALRIEDQITCIQGTKVSGIESLCILLRRLAYPNRLCDMSVLFGRSEPELSLIFNTVLEFLYEQHQEKLSDFDQDWITPQRFAEAIEAKGASLQNIWAFIDGTVRPICRPGMNQQYVFNGHKRTHALKYQAIVAPNGMIANLFGPFEGRRHDSALLEHSDVINQMQIPRLQNFSLYGDQAYAFMPNLAVPFRGALTPEQEQFNRDMANVRQAVEWAFKDITVQFAFVDFKKNQKLYLQPVGQYYLVSALLMNCRCCLYGNQTSEYFDVQPPTLEEYMV